MSKKHQTTVICEQCGAKGEFTIWDSINTVLDPEMKDKVRSGEAFQWICPNCGCKHILNYPTLYHQMEDHVMIYHISGDQTEAVALLKGDFLKDSGKSINIVTNAAQSNKNRVVGSLIDLREKLYIMDAGLDDRVIELMKIFLLSSLAEQEPGIEITECLFETLPDGKKLFSLHCADGEWSSTEFIEEIYDTFANEYKTVIETDNEVVIDFNWALKVLTA